MQRLKLFLLAIAFQAASYSQTVYLRNSPPQSVVVCGATNATPIVINTCTAHGFASGCGTSTTCYCDVWGVSTGTGVSPANGTHECHYVDSTHLSLYDLTNTAIAGTGAYWKGWAGQTGSNVPAQWVSQVTPFTANSGPIGYLDGWTGPTMRRLALTPANGLSSIIVSGGSGGSCASTGCTIAIATSYNPITGQGNFGVAIGYAFSITGTGTVLDTCGSGGGAQSPYTMASVSSSGWVSTSFTCTGLTTGTYTGLNMACGGASTPNDTISGTIDCATVSQLGTTANPRWNGVLYQQTANATATSPQYKYVFDGGQQYPDIGAFAFYGLAVMRFYVDHTPSTGAQWLSQILYALNNVERMSGVTFLYNEASDLVDNAGPYTFEIASLSLLYGAARPYWTASERTTFLNKYFNDLDDPTTTACTKTNVDLSTTSNHNWVLAGGPTTQVKSGTNDSTHVTLNAGDCYVNSIVAMPNLNNGHRGSGGSTYGLVTACAASSGGSQVATIGGGWNGGNPPTLQNLICASPSVCGTYVSGFTSISGTLNQTCALQIPGGTTDAYVLVPLTGTNTIAGGTPFTMYYPGDGFTSAPSTGLSYGAAGGASGWPGSATCMGTVSLGTTIGTTYTVFDSFIVNDTRAGDTTVATFSNTASLSGSVNVGDGIMAYNGWGQLFHPAQLFSMVTMVGSGTCVQTFGGSVSLTAYQACVINSGNGGGTHISASTTTPQMAWRMIKWQAGDCGAIWQTKHTPGNCNNGATPAVYPTFDLPTMDGPSGPIQEGGNLGVGDPSVLIVTDLAVIADDPRASRDLTRNQAWFFDYWFRHYADYLGWPHSGPAYSYDAIVGQFEADQWLLTQSVPGYTPFNFTDPAMGLMFNQTPDLLGGFAGWYAWGGGYGSGNTLGGAQTIGVMFDKAFQSAPQGNTAGYLRHWMEYATSYGSNPSLNTWTSTRGVEDNLTAIALLHTDPNTADVNYTAQPPNYVWNYSDATQCAALSGWPCGQIRGDYMVSRTGWTSLTNSLLSADCRTYAGSYDSPNACSVRFYKAGPLLAADSSSVGTLWGLDSSVLGDAVQFGGRQANYGYEFNASNYGGNESNITYWASANAGALGVQYGDQNGNYAYFCSNTANAYNASLVTIAYSNRCVPHFKKSGHDEIFMTHDDISAVANPTGTAGPGPGISMSMHLQYFQTVGNQASGIQMPGDTIPSGATTCINSSGTQVSCISALNSNRIIMSVESGGRGNSGNPPNETFGLISTAVSPGTIYLNWDCPNTGGLAPSCTQSSTYPGGYGFTDRVEVGAGSSAGTGVTGATWCVIHKVMQSLSDTTFSAAAVQPDANWFGCTATGALSTAVFVQGVGNTLRSSMTSFSVASSLPTDWIFGGLLPGQYIITLGGTPVTGSPFTVGAGDGSIYFSTSTGGTIAMALIDPTNASGTVKASGTVVIH